MDFSGAIGHQVLISMDLFFLYGPPASGKLTIARLLSEQTGFCLFDNTLSVNLAKSVFRFGSDAFVEMCREIRYLIFKRAVAEGVEGIIFTFCYSHPRDLPFVQQVERIVKNGEGQIHYVHVKASQGELEARVSNQDRKDLSKIDSVAALRENLRRSNYVEIPNRTGLIIDTSRVGFDEASSMIIAAWKKGSTSTVM